VVEPESPISKKPRKRRCRVRTAPSSSPAGENSTVDLTELAAAVEQRLGRAGHLSVSAVPEGSACGRLPKWATRPAIETALTEPGRLEIRPFAVHRGGRCADPPTACGRRRRLALPEYEFAGERTGDCRLLRTAPGGITNAAIEDATATINEPDQDGDRDDDYGVNLGAHLRRHRHVQRDGRRLQAPRVALRRRPAGIALDQVVLRPGWPTRSSPGSTSRISGDIDEEEANSSSPPHHRPLPRGLEFSD
jgi:hypothetical protein